MAGHADDFVLLRTPDSPATGTGDVQLRGYTNWTRCGIRDISPRVDFPSPNGCTCPLSSPNLRLLPRQMTEWLPTINLSTPRSRYPVAGYRSLEAALDLRHRGTKLCQSRRCTLPSDVAQCHELASDSWGYTGQLSREQELLSTWRSGLSRTPSAV